MEGPATALSALPWRPMSEPSLRARLGRTLAAATAFVRQALEGSRPGRVALLWFSRFVRGQGLLLGAGVAFYGLLSAIPLVILVAVSAAYLPDLVGIHPADVIARVLEHFDATVGSSLSGSQLEVDLYRLVEARARVGVLGFAALLVASSRVVRGLESAMHGGMARPPARRVGFFRKRLVNTFGVLLIVALYLAARLGAALATWMARVIPGLSEAAVGFLTTGAARGVDVI